MVSKAPFVESGLLFRACPNFGPDFGGLVALLGPLAAIFGLMAQRAFQKWCQKLLALSLGLVSGAVGRSVGQAGPVGRGAGGTAKRSQ